VTDICHPRRACTNMAVCWDGRDGLRRKSMLKQSLPIRLPLGGLADPLDSCAACAVYLPEGEEGDKFC
jgi:hypothetical protein